MLDLGKGLGNEGMERAWEGKETERGGESRGDGKER